MSNDRVIQDLLQRLDPVIRGLLDIVTQYQVHVQNQGSEQASALEYHVGILKQQIESVENLRGEFKRLHGELSRSDERARQLQPSMIFMAKYISLALTSLLHISSKDASSIKNLMEGASDSQWRVLFACMGCIFKLQADVACAIDEYIRVCHDELLSANQSSSININGSPDGLPPTERIPIPLSVSFLVALQSALPSGNDLFKLRPTSTRSNCVIDGPDSCIALLTAISTICDGYKSDHFSKAVVEALDGTLMLSMVDSCSGLLVAASPQLRRYSDLCLRALKTISSIMDAVPICSKWQFLFPSIFSGLYRLSKFAMRENKTGPVIEIHCLALRMITRLLRLTLQKEPPPKKDSKDTITMIRELNLSKTEASPTKRELSEQDQFFVDVNARVKDSLNALLVAISAYSHPKIRLEAVHMSRLLLETQFIVWDDKILPTSALESCLVLEDDADGKLTDRCLFERTVYLEVALSFVSEKDSVVSAAKDALLFYKTTSSFESEVEAMVVPRIVTLVGELPIVVESQNDVQVQAKIKIILAYLRLSSMSKQAALALEGATTLPKTLETLTMLGSIALSQLATVSAVRERGSKHFQAYRRMNKDCSVAMDEMLHEYGRALGTKAGALVIDACVADRLESCPLNRMDWLGTELTEWKLQWVGSIMFAREVSPATPYRLLTYLFARPHLASQIVLGAFEEPAPDCGQGLWRSRKSSKRRQRHLNSLSSSILGAITNSLFWEAESRSTSEKGTLFGDKLGRSVASSLRTQTEDVAYCVTVDFFTAMFGLLKKDTEQFLPMVLYTIVSELSYSSSKLVQSVSADSLEQISDSCGYLGSSELLSVWFGHLLGKMHEDLRIVGGGILPREQDWRGVLKTIHVAQTILQMTEDVKGVLSSSTLSPFVELIAILIKRIDYFTSRNAVSKEDVTVSLQFYNAVVSRLCSTCKVEEGTIYTYRMDGDDGAADKSSWEDLLHQFRLEKGTESAAENGYSSCMENEKSKDITLKIPASVLMLTARVMNRCNYHLSHHDLRVRILTCDVLTSGFRLFAFNATHRHDNSDEDRKASNFILEQAASLWPAINARLSITSEEAKSSGHVESLIIRPGSTNESGRSAHDPTMIRVFFSKLLTLVAAMCEGCGDFMADRFQKNVWPILSFQLASLLRVATFKHQQQLQSSMGRRQMIVAVESSFLPSQALNQYSWQGHESERRLLLGCLDCISRVFGQMECGQALTRMILVVGAVILPCLDGDIYDAEIVDTAYHALQRLLDVDCDVLWSRLVKLSGRPMQPNPCLPSRGHGRVWPKPFVQSALSEKCGELLDYIDSLPEQSI